MPRGKLNQMNGLEEIKMTHFDAKARKHHKQKDVGRLFSNHFPRLEDLQY